MIFSEPFLNPQCYLYDANYWYVFNLIVNVICFDEFYLSFFFFFFWWWGEDIKDS